jgi:hypothetical protein
LRRKGSTNSFGCEKKKKAAIPGYTMAIFQILQAPSQTIPDSVKHVASIIFKQQIKKRWPEQDAIKPEEKTFIRNNILDVITHSSSQARYLSFSQLQFLYKE